MRQELQEAKRVLRRGMGKVGKRHSRTHFNTADDNTHRLEAIEGICGSCRNLKIEFTHQDGRRRVVLRCFEDFSPLELYRKTEFGQGAKCSEFTKNGTQ